MRRGIVIYIIQNGSLKVRELQMKDNAFLVKWLSDPLVLKFYEGRDHPFDLERVNQIFYPPTERKVRCIVEFEENAIGYIQFYQLNQEARQVYGYLNEDMVIYGMDQFIGETKYWNRGIGTVLIKSVVDDLVHQKYADMVVMDPQKWNERAIRCYEKCGFKKVKLLPKHECHEGEYRDSWLIEYRISK